MDTFFRDSNDWRMVSFRIKFIRKNKNIFWAIFYTKAASLTSFPDYMHLSGWNLHTVNIQWCTPIFHGSPFEADL
jgi:hypothetical protein